MLTAINESRQRESKAKDEIVTLARTAVMVLKDHSPSMAQEMERRIFVLDSEVEQTINLLKGPEQIESLIELLSANGGKHD